MEPFFLVGGIKARPKMFTPESTGTTVPVSEALVEHFGSWRFSNFGTDSTVCLGGGGLWYGRLERFFCQPLKNGGETCKTLVVLTVNPSQDQWYLMLVSVFFRIFWKPRVKNGLKCWLLFQGRGAWSEVRWNGETVKFSRLILGGWIIPVG